MDILSQIEADAEQEGGDGKGGLTTVMKVYARKFCDLVGTTRMAAQRMAPIWRGEKAAGEMKNVKCFTPGYYGPNTKGGNCNGTGVKQCDPWSRAYLQSGHGCTWPHGSLIHPFPYIAPPTYW